MLYLFARIALGLLKNNTLTFYMKLRVNKAKYETLIRSKDNLGCALDL